MGFQAVSGLSINLQKSEIVWSGECSGSVNLARIMGCDLVDLPVKYLG